MTDLSYLVERNGLGAVGELLRGGRPITVAYLGGSITQAGTEDGVPGIRQGRSYRNRTTAWLRETFPSATIREINAGIGGTASDLGAFRLERNVLQYRPDLMFIEFGVNDGGMSDGLVLRSVEGIIRHALHEDNPPGLCLLYTLNQIHLPEYQQGQLPRTVRLHEQVAEHYGVPSINVALPVARQLVAGALRWDEFSGDTCHPTEMGHGLYGKTIADGLTVLFGMASTIAREQEGQLPPSLTGRPIEAGQMIPVSPEYAPEGWAYRPLENRGGWQCFDGVLESNQPGAEAEFAFEGPTIGLFYSLGPETGDLRMAMDDQPWQPLRIWDEYAERFWRPHYRILADDLGPGPHRLRIQVAQDAAPQSQGKWTRLAYLLCEGERENRQ